jgi:phytoene/squalene synthetase
MSDDVAACAELVRRGDPDRFLATMAAPPGARAVLFPLYAFNLEVARAPFASAEPMIGEMRLQWWRDVLGEIGRGAAPRAHEVVAPLAEVAAGGRLPLDVLDALVAAHRVHAGAGGFEDADHFEAFIERTGAGLMWAAAAALGAGAEAEPAVRAHGWASGLAAYFRAIPELEARGRQPLPDGRPEAVAALAARGRARLAEARRGRLPRAARPALLAGWRAEATLARAVADPGRVARGELAESEFRRRGSLLWRSMLGGW